ncbi:MAG TPA: class I SAM-dependent methyltransferase [Nitrospira sp.]|jgi:SAM-dependent methyltransferase|nr:class I SAM-dependent methyltransferase [Nitrospira sp.]
MPAEYVQRHDFRKWWEWEFIAECADLCGCLDGTQRGVGLGVGHDPLTFYFARHCQSVLATDLFSKEPASSPSLVDDMNAVHASSPIEYPREKVEVKNADMRRLEVPDGSMDFAWCCSNIGHVPTLKDLWEVFRELGRVLRIGGHAILTTEFCLTRPPYLLPGVNALDLQLFEQIIMALGGFEVVGNVDFAFNWAHPGNAVKPRRYPSPFMMHTPHGALMESFRSGQMASAVGISILAPIACVLKRRNAAFPDWQDLDLPRVIRDYTEAVLAVQARKVAGVCSRLETYVEKGPGENSLQLYTLLFRYYIEAMAIEKHPRPLILRKLESFLEHLPAGDLQDADCLDLVAYLLSECNDYANSARVYRLALASPSTTSEHAMRLSVDYLKVMTRLGKWEEAGEYVVELYRDLLIGGIGEQAVRHGWNKFVNSSGHSGVRRAALKSKLKRSMDQACAEFRQAVLVPSTWTGAMSECLSMFNR